MPKNDPSPDPPESNLPEGMGTEFLVREVVHGEKTQAWGALSQKILHYLTTRFGHAAFPPGTEFGDFTSDVMLRILTSIDGFEHRGKDSFWRWVQTLAGNVWRDLWRRHQRDQRLGLVGRGETAAPGHDTRVFSIPESSPSTDETPTQIVRFRELARAEQDCVARLPMHLHDVYLQRRQNELSFAEIAAKLGGANEATLRSHYMRARDRVRECLGSKIDQLGARLGDW